ncbi:hypothetical protein LSH36_1401g00009 [Paralvinella palmiformis]|uniref:G-protein coupled receptors family 1 profile domain-containing protein n=1 Tax=Paralvinella palmiformis TaxID=53620 RepID=A0AAD9MQE6_9ANNE|nr:hypothetical protein LSH36_1401g00009 [Paralvinella palmiformis]
MSYPYWEISVRILFSSLKFIYDTKSNLLPKKTAWTYSPLYNHIYAITLCYFLNYLVPLSMLVYIIVKLSISLRELNKKRQEMSNKAKERNDLTFSLVIVVLVFILCQLSNPLRRLLYVIYGPYHIGCGTVYFYFNSWSTTSVKFNSAYMVGSNTSDLSQPESDDDSPAFPPLKITAKMAASNIEEIVVT